MTYLVGENCIKCKHMDCVEVCPVDCFYEGENTLVINPDECIDCAVCEPECPVDAIFADTDDRIPEDQIKFWHDINEKYSQIWPNVTQIKPGASPDDKDQWDGVPNKYRDHWSDNPGQGD